MLAVGWVKVVEVSAEGRPISDAGCVQCYTV